MEITFMNEKQVEFGELKIGDGFIDGDGDFGIKIGDDEELYFTQGIDDIVIVGTKGIYKHFLVKECDYEIIVK